MGRIQQIQSFSTLDGPGTRCVIFFQGCPVACIFCHNPDSWEAEQGTEIEAAELLRQIERFRPFLTEPGLTITGGEPLLQPEFLQELIQGARRDGWHVALDTSGWGSLEQFKAIIAQVDLVIFSIKHSRNPRELCRYELEDLHEKLAALAETEVPVRLRYVLIPGWSDGPEDLEELAKLVVAQPHLEKLELLPFNGLAKGKWEKLKWDSPVFYEDTKLSEARLREIEEKVFLLCSNYKLV